MTSFDFEIFACACGCFLLQRKLSEMIKAPIFITLVVLTTPK